MAEELPDYPERITKLEGEVAALRNLVTSLLLCQSMPDSRWIADQANSFNNELAERVRITQNDYWRDFAAAAWNIAAPIVDDLESRISDYEGEP